MVSSLDDSKPDLPRKNCAIADDLAHVLWIGGSACAGKTSVARILAERYAFSAYHCDEHFDDHKARAEAARHPAFCRIIRRSPEDLWMRAPEEQAEELLSFYAEELGMVLADLRHLPATTPILAEGAGLTPTLLHTVDPTLFQERGRRRALWLVASGAFRRQRYPERGPWVAELLGRCRQPRRARDNWMDRDDLFAAAVAEDARRLGGHVVRVDGSRTIDETAQAVARHLHLAAERRAP